MNAIEGLLVKAITDPDFLHRALAAGDGRGGWQGVFVFPSGDEEKGPEIDQQTAEQCLKEGLFTRIQPFRPDVCPFHQKRLDQKKINRRRRL